MLEHSNFIIIIYINLIRSPVVGIISYCIYIRLNGLSNNSDSSSNSAHTHTFYILYSADENVNDYTTHTLHTHTYIK